MSPELSSFLRLEGNKSSRSRQCAVIAEWVINNVNTSIRQPRKVRPRRFCDNYENRLLAQISQILSKCCYKKYLKNDFFSLCLKFCVC